MTTLYVKNFSCLGEAEVRLKQLTILIGPQASGKSIISKLVFFFYDILSRQFLALEEQKPFEMFQAELSDEFRKWFPPSAWGKKNFVIRFVAGPYWVRVTPSRRRKPKGIGEVIVSFSPFFKKEYSSVLKSISSSRKIRLRRSSEFDVSEEFDLFWKIRTAAERKLKREMEADFVEYQLFIPAGRSFFTSIGKAIAAFEHGGILDPVTVRFGRFFATMKERARRNFWERRMRDDKLRFSVMHQFFGGRVRVDREQEFVECDDGRKIPFAMLSSGQQELLPLLLALDSFRSSIRRTIFYIEEPEAHLFPSAQSQLIEYLADSISGARSRNLLITTHSPYVPVKLNVLLKAGSLARRKPRFAQEIDRIVSRRAQLRPGSVAAYAIINNRAKSIMGRSGLIDAEYLDEVSGNLAQEFSKLLELEVRA